MSGLGEMGNLLKQAQEMQRQVDRVRSELRTKVVEGRAGGGVVRVEITSDRHEVKSVHISPDVLKGSEPALIEDLILRALQDAVKRAEETEKEAIGRVTGGMQLPGLF